MGNSFGIIQKEVAMAANLWGGVVKNSISPAFTSGFDYNGDMEFSDVVLEAGQGKLVGEDEIKVTFRGASGANYDLRELYFRISRDSANALAHAILSCNQSKVPKITINL
jgi:hypothetical protein